MVGYSHCQDYEEVVVLGLLLDVCEGMFAALAWS